MSFRPRFAGDGQLLLPDPVQLVFRSTEQVDQDDILAVVGGGGYDPFVRRPSGLLLAEEFARVDLRRRRPAREWYRQHGVLDLRHFFAPDEVGARSAVTKGVVHDTLADVLLQQANVQWHLRALLHLSDFLEEAGRLRWGGEPADGWELRWVQPVIMGPAEWLWLGATTSEAAHIGTLVQQYALPEDALGAGLPGQLGGKTGAAYRAAWQAARASYETIVAERIESIWVSKSDWVETWSTYQAGIPGDGPDDWPRTNGTAPLPWNWWGLLELQRRLLLPYVRRASQHRVEIERAGYQHEVTAEVERTTRRFPGPFEVFERREWSSLLAPVYLQLLEAWLRVSEGRRGAATCRECGEPFLTLDARRSSFCSDRHRARLSQRERRRRLVSIDVTEQRL